MEDLERLPQNGYSLQSKLRDIEQKEFDYLLFRESLKSKRKTFQELDYLDEMINDFNYMMFHQHLFAEQNEFELAKKDQWFNSPGLDLLFQDYCGVIGTSPEVTFYLNNALQYILLFPTILILDVLAFDSFETWVGFTQSGI